MAVRHCEGRSNPAQIKIYNCQFSENRHFCWTVENYLTKNLVVIKKVLFFATIKRGKKPENLYKNNRVGGGKTKSL